MEHATDPGVHPLMTEDNFDPYQEWLGIAPDEQPPNHYQLLGLELYEADSDIIAAAVDERMEKIRTYQLGQHMQESQDILSQLAAAKICLCSEDRKASYDESLRLGIDPEAFGVADDDLIDSSTGGFELADSDTSDSGDSDSSDGDVGFGGLDVADDGAKAGAMSARADKTTNGDKPAKGKGGLLRNKVVINMVMVGGGGVTALVIALVFGIWKGSGDPSVVEETETARATSSRPKRRKTSSGLPIVGSSSSTQGSVGDSPPPAVDGDPFWEFRQVGEVDSFDKSDKNDPFAQIIETVPLIKEDDDPFGESSDGNNPFGEADDDDPFGDSEDVGDDNPFGEEPVKDDPPADDPPADDDPFGEPEDTDDPFGESEDEDTDDPFGEEPAKDDEPVDDPPADDDPFGESEDTDDPFGESEDEDTDDPFGEDPAKDDEPVDDPPADDDDPFGDDSDKEDDPADDDDENPFG